MSTYIERHYINGSGVVDEYYAVCDECLSKEKSSEDLSKTGHPPFGWERYVVRNTLRYRCPECSAAKKSLEQSEVPIIQ